MNDASRAEAASFHRGAAAHRERHRAADSKLTSGYAAKGGNATPQIAGPGLSLFPQNHTDNRTCTLPERGFVADDAHDVTFGVEYGDGPVFDIVFEADDLHAISRGSGDVGCVCGLGKAVGLGVGSVDAVEAQVGERLNGDGARRVPHPEGGTRGHEFVAQDRLPPVRVVAPVLDGHLGAGIVGAARGVEGGDRAGAREMRVGGGVDLGGIADETAAQPRPQPEPEDVRDLVDRDLLQIARLGDEVDVGAVEDRDAEERRFVAGTDVAEAGDGSSAPLAVEVRDREDDGDIVDGPDVDVCGDPRIGQGRVAFTATSGNSVKRRADCQYAAALRNTLSWDAVTLGANPRPMLKFMIGRSTVTAKVRCADAPSGSVAVTVISASPRSTPRTMR